MDEKTSRDCAYLLECALIDHYLVSIGKDPQAVRAAAPGDAASMQLLRAACMHVSSRFAQGECIRNFTDGLRGATVR